MIQLDKFITDDFGENQKTVFTENVTISEQWVDGGGVMNLRGMLDVMQITAINHLNEMELPVQALIDEGILLFVVRISAQIENMPRLGDVVRTKTWMFYSKKTSVLRCHVFENQNGEKLLCAVSQWVCVDINSRKPIPSENFVERCKYPYPKMENGCPRPKNLRETCEQKSQISFKIGREHTDFYGHVNNAQYAGFIDRALNELSVSESPKAFRIAYLSEALPGDTMNVSVDLHGKDYYFEARHNRGNCLRAKVYYTEGTDDAEIFC